MKRQASLKEMFEKMEQQRIGKARPIQKESKEKNKNLLAVNHGQSNNKKRKPSESGPSENASEIPLSKYEEEKDSLSAKSDKISDQNVRFYLNQTQSVPKGDFIDSLHKKWWGNYTLLEEHHGFIQWLFPNAFQSRFNIYSQPLQKEEEKHFRQNSQIAERYVKSYMMMLEFYGMKLRSKETGQIIRSRKPKFQDRYRDTLRTRFHNHMRITRILSSLVSVGLGRYAKKLCQFLDEQINSPKGELKDLKKYGVFDRQWKEYKEYVETEEDLNVILRKPTKKRADSKKKHQ